MIAPAIVAAIALRFVDGVATVPYSVAPDTPFMNGNLPRMGRDVELLFEEPMDATHSDRVVYEAQGVQVDDRHHSRAVELRPIIEDEEGEGFDLLPQKTALQLCSWAMVPLIPLRLPTARWQHRWRSWAMTMFS